MATFPTRIIDHQDRLVEALPWPLGASERVEAWASAVGRQVQDVEDTQWDLTHETSLELAKGAQLVRWGERLGEPQGSLTVEEWRGFLKAKLMLRTSAGQAEEIVRILRVITGDQGPAYLYPMPPARVGLVYRAKNPLSEAHRTRVKQWMEKVVPAGVAIEHIIEAPLVAFGLDSDTDDWLEGLGQGLLGRVI